MGCRSVGQRAGMSPEAEQPTMRVRFASDQKLHAGVGRTSRCQRNGLYPQRPQGLREPFRDSRRHPGVAHPAGARHGDERPRRRSPATRENPARPCLRGRGMGRLHMLGLQSAFGSSSTGRQARNFESEPADPSGDQLLARVTHAAWASVRECHSVTRR